MTEILLVLIILIIIYLNMDHYIFPKKACFNTHQGIFYADNSTEMDVENIRLSPIFINPVE
jgi:hypothetical protein